MKKTLVISVIAVFLSFGFTVVSNTPENISSPKSNKTEKLYFSNMSDEKRLASWD